jgi:PhzF family phenazine biosynthesis protein
MMEQKAQNGLPIYQVDAFTDLPFRGNPAAVCLLQKPLHEEIMQNIAQEMNLSETAFVVPLDQSSPLKASVFSLRWFTPQVEVPLCGHATLAASAVLFHEMGHPGPVLHFETRSGQLTAQKEQEGILLNFPAEKPQSVALPLAVLRALGNPKAVRSAYAQGKQMLLIELENEEELRSLKPDFELLKQADVKVDTREGLMITSIAQPPYDFVSRFFAPWIGINEDPVTGYAHTVLAPYWGEILGKQNMLAYQASPRGGEIKLQIINPQRVSLLGRAVIVLKGTLQW